MAVRTVTVPPSIPFPALGLGNVVQNLLGLSIAQTNWLIENGCVKVNQKFRRKSFDRLEPGDFIEVDVLPMPALPQRQKKNSASRDPVEFLMDDEWLCVVNKPAGLLTVPTRYAEKNTLISKVERMLKQHDREVNICCVHRLDRDVSGVLVFAKGLEMAEAIRNQFADRKPDRQYIALIAGVPAEKQGTIRSYLATDADLNRYSVEDPAKGELAITHYRVTREWNDSAMVEVRLETGRRNQIRIHMAELGTPIVGETRYRIEEASHWAWPHKRIALHAESLTLQHPKTGETIQAKAPWPQAIRDFVRMVDKRKGH